MSAWSGVLAMSGFRYRGEEQAIEINAPAGHRCLWTTGTGWGTFRVTSSGATIQVEQGTLPIRTCIVNRRPSSPGKTLQAGEQLQV